MKYELKDMIYELKDNQKNDRKRSKSRDRRKKK